jgi:cytoskeletal protein RodZ
MVSIGEELKREREFREISLREISDATKINIRMLEAIEKDNLRFYREEFLTEISSGRMRSSSGWIRK